MKSLNIQGQWTGKFALKFFLALLFNNFLFISESFLPGAIAFAQSTPQPTISYPYKLFPNQSSIDCAIGEDTDFPFDNTKGKITEILNWNEVEKKAWLTICEGKPFDSLSYFLDANWLNDFNELEKETKQQGYKCQLDREKITVSKLQISLDCFKRYISKQKVTNENITKKLKKLSTELKKNSKISNNFLKTILLREPFRSALPNKVIIKNVIFTEEVDLSSTNINVELHLINSIFEKKVKFSNTQFSRSLYLDGSIFEDIILINNALIESNLFLRNVTLKPNLDLLKKEGNIDLLNLSRIKVNGEVQIKDQKLVINNQCNSAKVTPLNLNAAQIGISLEMQGSQWIQTDNSSDCVNDLLLAAIKIGDALIMDSNTEFSGLNLSNSQIQYLIINVPEDRYNNINDIKTSINYFLRNENQLDLSHFINVKINFEDANISNFQVNPVLGVDEFPFFPNLVNKEQNICNFQLDGLVYEDVNFPAFNLLNFCLDKKFKQVIENKRDSLTANKLSQPLDQLTLIARNLGRYRVEDELLYRRKRLELVIAEENELFWEWLQLSIGDILYGFGYQRTKILYFFLGFLALGIGFAYVALTEKQKNLLKKTIELRNHEIDDELYEIDQAKNIERYICVDFDKIKPHLDFIDRIIFDGRINSDEKEKIYLGLKPELDSSQVVRNKILRDSEDLDKKKSNDVEFVKINLKKNHKDNIRDIKYIVENVDERSKNNRKVGICEDLLPNSGLHLVYSIGKSKDDFHVYSLEKEEEEDFSCTNITIAWIIAIIIGLKGIILTPLIIYKFILTRFTNTNLLVKDETIVKSLIYSLDSIIPIIELDQELKDFIVEDSEGLPKGYFIFQQILGAIIASILLPILFITGL